MTDTPPTIKGIFVLSHLKALEKLKGAEALKELERRYGKPIQFKNSEDVPIREEIEIIKHALDLSSATPVDSTVRERTAGALHFENFSHTPLGKLVLPIFRGNFKLLMMNAHNIAGHVFQGVGFHSEDMGPKKVTVTMENNDYPIDHFKGFFEAWLAYSNLTGEITAKDLGDNRYLYTAEWK